LSTTAKEAADGIDLYAVAHRIDQLIQQLQSSAGAGQWSQIEELVRALTDLYGAGLTRTVELAQHWVDPEESGAAGEFMASLAGDELVASLLVLHDAHPDGLAVRAKRAVADTAPTILANGGQLRLAGVDPESGIVRVAVTGTGSGCGFDPAAVVDEVRQTLWDALPDASSIEVEMVVDQSPVATPVRLSRKKAPAGAGP